MSLKWAMMLMLRKLGFKILRLRPHFNTESLIKPAVLSYVHVVDKEGLKQLAAGSSFNENLFLTKHSDKNFPEFLQIEPYDSTYFICCDDGGRFIASATLRPDQTRQTEMMISQISIHPSFRNKGYATRLLIEIAHYLNTVRPDVTRLSISGFLPMGRKYLRQKFIEIAPAFKAETFEIYQETYFESMKKRKKKS